MCIKGKRIAYYREGFDMLLNSENKLQLQRAWMLARAYDHAWGQLEYDVIINAKGWQDVSGNVLLNHTPGLPYGIDKPYVNDEDGFEHVTASGRLKWLIEPSGNTTFLIMRPGSDVPALVAKVDKFGGHTIDAGENGFGMRHIDALKVALNAVGVLLAAVPLSIFLAAIDQDTRDLRDKFCEAANLLEDAAANADDWRTCHLLSSEIEKHMYAQIEALDKKRAELIAKAANAAH